KICLGLKSNVILTKVHLVGVWIPEGFLFWLVFGFLKASSFGWCSDS
ncbi:hypothetical protein CEXT_455191, partial [Caerostris extrusa]